MHETVPLPNDWYIYRIKISNNDQLGFLVPSQLKKVNVALQHSRLVKLDSLVSTVHSLRT